MAASSNGRALKRSGSRLGCWLSQRGQTFFLKEKLILVTKIALRIENVRSRIYSCDNDCDGNENTAHFTFSFIILVTSCGAAWELNLRILKLGGGGESKGIMRHNVRRINISVTTQGIDMSQLQNVGGLSKGLLTLACKLTT